MNIQGLMNWK